MNRKCLVASLVLSIGASALVGGCAPKITKEMMREMRPNRPTELDALNRLAGTWDVTAEMRLTGMDETIKGKGGSTNEWSVNGWYLMGHGKYDMEDIGTMEMLEMWTYDPSAKVYRSYWFDDMGGYAQGKGNWGRCGDPDCFCLTAVSHSDYGTTHGKGCMRFVDDNTIEWKWSEWPSWDIFGLFKMFEYSGTSVRR